MAKDRELDVNERLSVKIELSRGNPVSVSSKVNTVGAHGAGDAIKVSVQLIVLVGWYTYRL